MALTHTYIPSFPLHQFVDVIWVGKAAELEVQANHYAPLFSELIFNYGDLFAVKGQHIVEDRQPGVLNILSGLKTTPFETTVSGAYCNVGLILKPFCYGVLLDKLQSRVMNTISNLLFEHLIEPESPDFIAIEQHLLRLFDGYEVAGELIKFEHHVSSELMHKGALKHFSRSLSITQKSFIQKFKKHYFITPGQYVKLKQVNYAVKLLESNTTTSLTQVGLDAGFYDQAHFIKVFKQFCGASPKQFLNRKNAAT